MIRALPLLATFLLTLSAFGQGDSPTIFKPGPPPLAVTNSYCNEQDRDIVALKRKLMCYQCCAGELDGSQCKEFNNHKNCAKKKDNKCGCG